VILVGAVFTLFGALALTVGIYRLTTRQRRSTSGFAYLMIYLLPPIAVLVFGVAVIVGSSQP